MTKTPNRGDRLDIRAKDWGDMLTVMERFRTGEIKFEAPALESTLRSATTVKILNDSGGPLSQCAIVGLGEPVITPDLNEQEFLSNFAFRTIAPLDRRWGILQTPSPPGEIATAVIAGVTTCKINVDSEVLPVNFVSLEGNQLVPFYGSGDASVLWRAGGLGLQWAIIRFGQVATVHHLFTLTSDMDSGTGQAVIRDMDDSFTIEEDSTVLDPLGIFAELTEGTRGICVSQLGKYYIVQAECE